MSLIESLVYYWESVLIIVLGYALSIFLFSQHCKRLQGKKDGQNSTSEQLKNSFFRIVSLLPVAIIVGIRSCETGADSYNVYKYYLRTMDVGLIEWLTANKTSLLYDLVRWLVCHITNGNVQVFLLLLAIVTLYFVLLAIEEWHLKYSGTALFIYYCVFGLVLFDQARQMLAVAIMLYAYYYMHNNMTKKYLGWVIVAGLVHITSFVAGLIILALAKRKKQKYQTQILVLSLALCCLLMPLVLKAIGIIFEGTKYAKYAIPTGNGIIGLGFFLALLPNVFLTLLLQKNMDSRNTMRDAILVTIVTRYAGYVSTFLSRMNYYFAGVSIIALPYALENIKRRRCVAMLLIYGCCAVYFLLWYWWRNAAVYLPYMTFWQMPFIE